MNIIVGASGQVGSMVIKEIINNGLNARAVVRNPEKISLKDIEIKKADLFNKEQLTRAFEGGTTAFLLTPENPFSDDVLGDTERIVENYISAIRATGICRVIGLSCVGAHIDSNTGNILMSRILEQGIESLAIERIFIRPSYYFSNWLGYRETIEQYGLLPTFFPADFKLEMHSPADLARFIAQVLTRENFPGKNIIYELGGPQKYSSLDVAEAFSKIIGKDVNTQTIPPEKWMETFSSIGFSENAAKNFTEMTKAVIDGLTLPEFPDKLIRLGTTLQEYVNVVINTKHL